MKNLKYAILLVAYAVALALVGYITYAVAPPGSNAKTALFITAAGAGLTVVCAVLTLLGSGNRMLAMIGIHVALVIPLIMAAGPAMRLSKSLDAAKTYNEQAERFVEAMDSGPVMFTQVDTEEQTRLVARTATGEEVFTAESAEKWHSVGYQTVGLTAVVLLSIFAFFAFITHRPPVPAKAVRPTDDE